LIDGQNDQTDNLNRSSEASGVKRTFTKLDVWFQTSVWNQWQ